MNGEDIGGKGRMEGKTTGEDLYVGGWTMLKWILER
jgi:hypothetical protein